MKQYLIDTDILIDYFNQISKSIQIIEHELQKEDLIISIITLTEIVAGLNNSKRGIYLPHLHGLVTIEKITPKLAEKAGIIRYEYAKKGKVLATTDVLIAATAIEYNYILITKNKKDFPMKEIKFYEEKTTS